MKRYPAGWPFTPQCEADIRARWVDGDPVGEDCGERRVRPERHHDVLEALRHARSDVATLLAELDRLRRLHSAE